jgi:hypothetical protein
MVEADRERYDAEMKQYEEQGYFTNGAGVKSTFLDKKHRVLEFERGTIMPRIILTSFWCFFKEQ